jgi:hypothetical protein
MNNNTIPNFSDFLNLNESESTAKKNLGIIGPLANWSLKLQVYPEPNQGMIGYAIDENGNRLSKTGENYLTIQYEKLVPLLVSAIQELSKEIDRLKKL